MKYIQITNLTHPEIKPILAKYCSTFGCQLRGLMFTKSLPEQQGLLLVQGSDSRINSSIHMMFMWMDLGIIWINSAYEVVDTVLARRWAPLYVSRKPAKYMLELDVKHLDEYKIGDIVHFAEIQA